MSTNNNAQQSDISKNIEFLFNSYTNTLQTIQFFDTKAGAYVAVIGVLASLTANNIVRVLNELFVKQSVFSKYVLASIVAIMALCFLYT